MSIHPEIFENDAFPLQFFFKFEGYIYHLETCKNPKFQTCTFEFYFLRIFVKNGRGLNKLSWVADQ